MTDRKGNVTQTGGNIGGQVLLRLQQLQYSVFRAGPKAAVSENLEERDERLH